MSEYNYVDLTPGMRPMYNLLRGPKIVQLFVWVVDSLMINRRQEIAEHVQQIAVAITDRKWPHSGLTVA